VTTLRLVGALSGTDGIYADYDERMPAPVGWQRIDVRAVCHRHQGEWADAICRWHDQVMVHALAATPWAWVLPGARLHIWHGPVRPFLFALGLWTHLRDHPSDSVVAVGCPPEVGPYVEELSGGRVRVVDERPSSSVRRRSRQGLVGRLLRIVGALRGVPVWLRRRKLPAGIDTLVVSIGLSADNIRERGDHFFGRAIDTLGLNVFWLYQVGASNDRAGIDAALGQSGRRYDFDHRLVSWADVAAQARTAWDVRRQMVGLQTSVPDLHIAGTVCGRFSQTYFRDLFAEAMPLGELLLHQAAARVMAAGTPRALCYPYEEKGLERALLMAAHGTTHPVKTVGFAHAAYNSGMLYLAASTVPAAEPPRPDVLVSAGLGLEGWLASEFRRREAVVPVGSPRWAPVSAALPDRVGRRPLRVLFLTGLGPELFLLLRWLAQCPTLFDEHHLTVRAYPHSWHDEQQAASVHLRPYRGVTVEHDEPMASQLRDADLVLYCSTSAVAEAVRHGRLVAFVEWSDLWSTDPLRGKADADMIPRCVDPAQLLQVMQTVADMDADAYAHAVAAQRPVADCIYAPFDSERFRSVVTVTTENQKEKET